MKKGLCTIAAMIFIIAISSSMFAAEEDDTTYVHGRAVIKVTEPFSQITTKANGVIDTENPWFNQLADEYEIYKLKKVFSSNKGFFRYYYIIEFPEDFAVLDVCEDFKAESEVTTAFPDFIVEMYAIPNDEYYSYQWPLTNVQAEEAWDVVIENDEPIILAILDTGVDVAHPDTGMVFVPHPDLADNLYIENDTLVGHNYYWPEELPFDNNGHGTHVAGIAAAVSDNTEGVASLAGWENYNVKIMPVKVLNRYGYGSWTYCLAGVEWAANHGADIINMSWGCDVYDPGQIEEIEITIDYAVDSCNCLCIAASGRYNLDHTEIPIYPAYLEKVIAVSATNSSDNKSFYSPYADWIEVSAPGGELYYYHDENAVLSCAPKHYAYLYYDTSGIGYGNWIDHEYDFMSGTSMASPFVASLAAMIKAKYPDSTNQYIRGRILGTTDDIYYINQNYIGKLGAGRINAYHAIIDEPHPNIIIHSFSIIEDDNGIFEYGETAELEIELKNWWIDAENVQGTLSTNDPYITIVNNYYFFNDIGQYDTTSNGNSPFVLTDNSVSPRVIDFTLHLEADNMVTKDIEFKVTVYPNANTPLVDLSLGANYEISTEIITSDYDLDGSYEIVVGASNGNLYMYNHPDLNSYQTNANIICTPAIGDVNNDGYEEIVFGNDNGNVYVLDKDGNLMHQYQVNGMCKHAIVLEDVTGDGQLEIIVSTWKYTGNATGMDGFYIIDPVNFNMYSYDTSYRIQRPFSVADVNNDSTKEIVVPLKNKYFESHNEETNSHIKFFTISHSFELEEIWEIVDNFNYLSGPILTDIDEDGVVEILINFARPITEEVTNWLYAYRFGQYDYVWDIKLTDVNAYQEQLIVGDFLDYIDGFEIATPDRNYYSIIDCNGNLINKLYCDNQLPTPMIFSDINSDGNQELLVITNSSFLALDDDTNYLEEWRIYTDELNPFVSVAMGNVTADYDNEIVLITQDGTIYAFPIEYSTTSTSEWSQYQNNSRNTGSYFQPLPEVIGTDITVKHNVVVDTKISFPIEEPEARLIINPGNEILFESCGLIEGRNVQAVGTEENPIVFSGLCADTTKNYWDGISIFGCDEAQFEYCTITNAETGIFMENTENNVIKDCKIMYNDIGISLFTSSPFIRKNNISYNNYGIAGFHESMPILSNLDTLGVPFTNAVVVKMR